MDNKFGRLSQLKLRAGYNGEKTVLRDVDFTAPFKIMHPFYEKKDVMTVMILTASAGIMAGDRQYLQFNAEQGAHMEVVSQAYEKIHKMEEGEAKRRTQIFVAKNASLHYMPLPAIPFEKSAFESEMNVELEDESSGFVLSEILTCGRAARGERFAFHYYKSRVNIRQGGRLIYRDNTYYDPGVWDMNGIGMYEGYTHLANLVICNSRRDSAWVAGARALIDEAPDMEGGVTQNGENLTVVRILGRSGQRLTGILEKIQRQ